MDNSQQQTRSVNASLLTPEISFTASRSDGPGGQNVNKVSSKITLKLDIGHSGILNEEEKQKLRTKLKNRLTKDGVLILSEQGSRSQLQNKEQAIIKLDRLLEEAFKIEKKRRKTKPSKSSVEKRIKGKRIRSEKKQWRRDI